MREIKFRAWDKKKKKIVSHDRLFRLDCSNEYPFLPLLLNWYSDSIKPFDVVIMQYTGLKDKNGKEIYEGDILKTTERQFKSEWPAYDAELEKETEILFVAEFIEGGYGFKNHFNKENLEGYARHTTIYGNQYRWYFSDGKTRAFAHFNHHDFARRDFVEYNNFEVIGNIYENPELLKGDSNVSTS